MVCALCGKGLQVGRLFCIECGEVTPEGRRVMQGQPERPSLATVDVPARLARPRRRGEAARTSTPAVLSLGFGLLSFLALPVVGALIAIAAGHCARKEIRLSGGSVGGHAFATTGLVLGYGQLALIGLAVLFVLAVVGLAVGAA